MNGSKVTKQKVKQNVADIKILNQQLEVISDADNAARRDYLQGLEPEEAKRISSIKNELTVLRRQRYRLEAKLALIRRNLVDTPADFQGDFSDLQSFFPSVELRKLHEIERFHSKIQRILGDELREELKQTETLLAETVTCLRDNEERIEAEGVPNGVSRAVFDSYAKVKEQIAELLKENEIYSQSEDLRVGVATIDRQMYDQQSGHLRQLQATINQVMYDINAQIYGGLKTSPVLTLNEDGKSYVFETPDDTGTGTSYKGLVVFDLSILRLTPLPSLIHDSVVLKQIADAPLEKILELYQQSGKQVFIALDKGVSYTHRTQEILESTAVLRLFDNGGELFGRSWNMRKEQMDQTQ